MAFHKRIQWLDFAKGFTIFFVVLAHSIQFSLLHSDLSIISKDCIFIFIMPVFFSISGYLYKKCRSFRDYLILLYKKITSFFVPYFVFTIIFYIINNIHIKKLRYLTLYNVFKQIVYYLFIQPDGYMWFLYTLFLIFIIVGTFDLLHLNLSVQILISIFLFGYQALRSYKVLMPNGNVIPLAGIGGYMIFFYMGELIHKYQPTLMKFLFSKKLLLPLILSWIISLFSYFIYSINDNSDSVDVVTYADIFPKLIGMLLFFNFFSNFRHNKFFNYFDQYGKQTLIIYLVHFLGIMTVSKILMKLNSYFIVLGAIRVIILLIIGWYLSIFICKLSTKYKWINFMFYPRKYINKIVLRTKWGKTLLRK